MPCSPERSTRGFATERAVERVAMQAAAALGGALRVVVRAGHCGQGLEVVRRAGLVPRLSRQGQSLRQVFCGAAQIAPSLAAERQVVQRDENGQPLGRPTGGGQALGEQPRRGVGISLGEPDLPEEVVYLGDGERQEIRGVPVVRPRVGRRGRRSGG